MTTSTPHAKRPPASADAAPRRPSGRRETDARGFTLTEVIIASSLSAFVLAGVLSTFLLLGRSGMNSSAYVEMNARLRSAIERFDQDVRLARDLRWQDEKRITLILPAGSGVTYAFEPASDPAAPGRFVRQTEGGATEVLARDVAPDFAFGRYRLPDDPEAASPAANDLETALLEVRLRAVRPGASAPAASQLGLSARCVLRNKHSGA